MMQIIDELHSLRLHMLDDAWVQGIYYSEFLEFGEFPAEYESILENLDVPSVFENVMISINNWLEDDSEIEKSWTGLSQFIPHEKLLAILAYYIDYGTKNVLTKEYRNNAILACRLYYKFLAVSGFKAYHIYHSQLFAHSLACLSFPKILCDNENSFYNTKELTKDVNSIIKELQHFVIDLRAIMMSLQLNPSDMNFEDILSNLVDVTGGAIVNKLNVDKIELATISKVIYDTIDILLMDSNGTPDPVAIRLLFKSILPKLVAVSVDCKSSNNLARASYVTYSGLLLTKYGKSALSGYMVLLQHLCYTQDGLERFEVRQARVSLIVGMMSLLPRKSYRGTIKWLLTLSTTSKVAHRHIALEILAKLLRNDNDPDEENSEEANAAENPGPSNVQQNEVPPTENETLPGSSTDESVASTSTAEPVASTSTSSGLVTEDESSQESKLSIQKYVSGVPEDEVAGLLRARPHTTPYSAVLVALFERANDSNSTLRARALAILTQCLSANNPVLRKAIQDLNGPGPVSQLTALGSRAVCDTRAAVRRAALTLVHQQLTAADRPLDATEIGLLSGLCRDASIQVRTAAIVALGELAITRPGPVALDAFLAGPLHQLSDPEIKVQEEVVILVRGILIERLAARTEGPEDPLPWLFLEAIARHNVRPHLQKACVLLAKTTPCISHRMVDAVSTHLGAGDAARDLQCLVLLTCAAKLVDYGDVTFAIQYYYKLTDGNEVRDLRLLHLTLELLTTWARWAAPEARATLRERLVQRLATATTNDCRLACANLAMNLDPENLTWANELLHMAERCALIKGASAEECVRAADLAMVAPTPPDPGLLGTALNALQPPYADLSDSQAGTWAACVGRLCVRSRAAAARAAPSLAALMGDGAAPIQARLNALRALTDICTRYTCIVEPLMGGICGCVSRGAPSPLRRAAARCLTRLLLAGYLRLRTPLYYKYCALLADDEPDVREPAEYYVMGCLLPETIYHHFVDCVLNYNALEEEESERISFDARQLIYDVMLQRLSIVQKLNLQCRLAREILQHAADVTDEGDGELPPALNDALLDTITLLCGLRMKLPRKPQRDGEAADIDYLQERITTNIVSHKMKRTVAEVVVPAVLRLYSRLAPRGGQAAAYLVRIANDMLNDYRNEIEELIENDEELVERVRQFQETIGVEPSFGNMRNLVTASTAHDPETPRAPRKRPHRGNGTPHQRKRALRI